MKNLIFIIAILLIDKEGFSQLIDNELFSRKLSVYNYLILYGEIDSSKTFSNIEKNIYSRELKRFSENKIIYYEIGLTVSHGYKFLGILTNNKRLTLLPSKDFCSDFDKIMNPISSIKTPVKLNETILFIKQLEDLYKYNTNPPWKKEF